MARTAPAVEALEDRRVLATIAVFDNPNFVDTANDSAAESDNLQASLVAAGHTVNTFTGTSAAAFTAALSGADILTFPELTADLATALNSSAEAVIGDFVNNGGGLIISANGLTRDEDLMNSIFGFTLANAGLANGGTINGAASAGTSFAGGPASLGVNDAVGAITTTSVTASGGTSIYTDINDADDTVVARFGVGAGTLVYLGWDWFNSDPPNAGGQDGNWQEVLSRAVTEVTPAVPDTFIVDTDTDAVDGNTASRVALYNDPGNDGFISLREAILAANNDAGDDTVDFDASLASSTITLTNGGLSVSGSITINGLGADQLAIDGNGGSIFGLDGANADKTFTINDLTLTGATNTVNMSGSNLSDVLNINGVVARDNTDADSAGSVMVAAFGTVNVTDTAIVNNAHNGHAFDISSGSATFTNVTISGNDGNAISIFAGTNLTNSLSLLNVTITDNGGAGVQVRNFSSADTTLTVDYRNSILADNTDGNFEVGTVGGTLSITSLGRNILDDTPSGDAAHAAGVGDQRDTDPMIGPLEENTGTFVHPVLIGSPAIDAADDLAAPAADQRGVARNDGNNNGNVTAEIGAYEFVAFNFDFDAIDEVTVLYDSGSDEVRIVETANTSNVLAAADKDDIDELVNLEGDSDDNVVTVDASFHQLGFTLDFDGNGEVSGTNGDLIVVQGSGTQDAVYTPDAAITGAGMVVVTDGAATTTITFESLEPVDISGMATATLTLPGANDTLTIAEGVDFATGLIDAIRVSGTTGDTAMGAGDGVAIETAAFFNNGEVIIDTTATDGDDLIEIDETDNAHGNTDLTILTGAGNDVVNLNGNLELDLGPNTSADGNEDLRIETQQINLSAAGVTATIRVGDTVSLDAGTGSITEGFNNAIFTTNVVLDAGTGIGDASSEFEDIDIHADNLAARTVTGDIFINDNNGTLNIVALSLLGGGDLIDGVDITTGGVGDDLFILAADAAGSSDLTIDAGVSNAGPGDLILAMVAADGDDDDIIVDANVEGNGGAVRLISEGDVFSQVNNITISNTGEGSIDVHAGREYSFAAADRLGAGFVDLDGDVFPLPTSNQFIFNAEDGDILVTATDDIFLGRLNADSDNDSTGAAVDAANGAVTVTADVDGSGDGAIIDSTTGNGAGNENIIGGTITLSAATGIGDAGAIDIEGVTLAATNGEGDIRIDEVDSVTIGMGDGVDGVSLTDTGADDGGDAIVINAGTSLTVDADITNDDTGNITLATADSAAAGEDITVNTGATVSTLADIFINAGDNITLRDDSTLMADGVTLSSDFGNADAGTGSTIELAGDITAATLEAAGDTDDDILRFTDVETGQFTFTGDLDGVGNGHTNSAFVTSALAPQTIGIHYDGGAGGDQIEMSLTDQLDVSYFADDDTAANSGVVNVSGEFTLSFTELAPLILSGAGGTLTVDASALPALTTLTVMDDPADTAGPGGNVVTGDGGFETTFFNGFTNLVVRSGDGDETITLVDIDPAANGADIALEAITLDGDNIGNTDMGNDTIIIQSLPAVNGEAVPQPMSVTALGGGGNDTISLGDTTPEVSNILGMVIVDGEGQVAGGTTSGSVTAKGNLISETIDTGDTLNINDQGYAMAAEYNLGDGTFDRDGTVAPTMFSNVETVNLNAGSAANDIDIVDTANDTFTSVTSQGAADDIDITTTGDDSIVLVNAGNGANTVDVATTGSSSVLIVIGGDDVDTLTQASSGAASGVELRGAGGNDIITIQSSGAASSSLATGGAGNDTIEIQNAGAASFVQADGNADEDTINLRALVATAQAQLNGGAGNDTINLGSTDDATSVLTGILGSVMIDGQANDATPDMTESVTAKGITVTETVPVGDTVNFNDQGYAVAANYNLGDGTFDRDTVVAVTMFTNVETINLNAGSAANDIDVDDTTDGTKTTINSQDAADDIDVTTTGIDSILIINAAGGADDIDIALTGDSSVTIVNGGDDADTIDLADSGAESGVELNGEAGADVITIADTGDFSVALATGGDGTDTITIAGAGAMSSVQADGDAADDSITLEALPADAQAQLNGGAGNDTFTLGDATPVISNILGSVMIDGGDNEAAPTMTNDVTAKGTTVTQTLAVGDTLTINDQAYAAAANYNLDDGTFDRDGTVAMTMFTAVETINLNTGTMANDIDIDDTPDSSKTTVTSQDAADDMDITTTGDNSILIVNAAGGDDVVDIASTGATSVTQVFGGDDNDTLTLNGSGAGSGVSMGGQAGDDTLNVNGTGANSVARIGGGAGNNTFNVTATGAGSGTDLIGGPNTDEFNIGPNLDLIEGDVCVFGNDHDVEPTNDLTIKGDTNALEGGDVLNVTDTANAAARTYTISDTTIDSSGMAGTITYETVEEVEFTSTTGAADVDVTTTLGGIQTTITTQGSADDIDVTTTGADSNVIINTAGGADDVNIVTTGVDGADGDALGAFVQVNAGADNDTITLQGTADMARVEFNGEAGDDTENVWATGVMSGVQLNGGANNDIFNLGSPAMTTDGISPDTVMIDGGANTAGDTRDVEAGANVINSLSMLDDPAPYDLQSILDVDGTGLPNGTSVATLETGDTVNVLDSGEADNNTYTNSTNDTLARNGDNLFMIVGDTVETVNIEAGTGDDLFIENLPFDPDVVSFDGGAGMNHVVVLGSANDDIFTVGPAGGSGGARNPLEIMNVSCLQIEGGDGNDELVNNTAVSVIIDGGAGDDILVGGSNGDVILGGDGVDALFGQAGNDFLFSDENIQGDQFADDGELLDGGLGLGDAADQQGVDFIRNVEILEDGGANKSVLFWLRGVIADVDLDDAFETIGCFPFLQADAGANTNIGNVTMFMENNVNVMGEASFTFNPDFQPGFLTINGDYVQAATDPIAPLRFYLVDDRGIGIGVSAEEDGSDRIDAQLFNPAREYTLVVFGTNPDVDLTFTNALTQNSPLTIHGTEGDDVVSVTTGESSMEIVYNGVPYTFQNSNTESVTFLGNGGFDTFTVDGISSTQFTVNGPGSTTLTGSPTVVHTAGVEQIDYLLNGAEQTYFSSELETYDWQNAQNPHDVDASGLVTLHDALLIVSEIRRGGVRHIAHSDPGATPSYFDTNGDGMLTLADALLVVAEMRSLAELEGGEGSEGEGESGEGASASAGLAGEAAESGADAYAALLAAQATDDDDDETSAIDAAIDSIADDLVAVLD